MPDERGTLRRIDWRELCPWLIILKTFRLAVGVRVLTLMFVALFVSAAGWNILGMAFSVSEDPILQKWVKDDSAWPLSSLGRMGDSSSHSPAVLVNDPLMFAFSDEKTPVQNVWGQLSEPFIRIFRIDATFVQLAYCILGCLWSVVVWGLFGGAVTRIAAVALAREDRLGLMPAVGFARQKWFSFVSGPLFPFVGVVMAVVPLMVIGWLLRMDFLLPVAAILWPLVLLGGAFLAIVTLGLLLGWPLMWGTISTEGTDAFDALSRSYNYLRERPLHYLFYVVIAALYTGLCLAVTSVFIHILIHLAQWGFSWGYGTTNLREILTEPLPDASWFLRSGAAIISFYDRCLLTLITAAGFGLFWTSMTAVYLLMRLRVDATELDEAYMPDEEQAFGMPPLTTDAAGVPKVADAPPDVSQ